MNKYRVITHTRTRTLAIIAAVVFCVLLCCVFCAFNTDFLNDNSFKNDKDYIEVESLRISNAPTGDTSKYKLNVEVLPANATNRKLTYYIPSEYYEFVNVSNDGVNELPEAAPARPTKIADQKPVEGDEDLPF